MDWETKIEMHLFHQGIVLKDAFLSRFFICFTSPLSRQPFVSKTPTISHTAPQHATSSHKSAPPPPPALAPPSPRRETGRVFARDYSQRTGYSPFRDSLSLSHSSFSNLRLPADARTFTQSAHVYV